MTKNNIQIDKKIIEELINDRDSRIEATKQSHLLFFHTYFAHYVEYETARFQKEMFAMTEKEQGLDVIIAFRDSGKSSIVTTSYPLWAILGKQEKKFVLILSQTQNKARQHLKNMKRELENNQLLRDDLGPFQEESDEWGVHALTIPRFNAKIMIGSVDQSIRGIRHLQYRPDCIILDDIEDTQSVKTKDGRDKTWNWFTGEIIPATDRGAHLIAVGNLLHRDSLLKRIEASITSGDTKGTYKEFPIIDGKKKPLWPDKYPNEAAITAERERVMDRVSWHREYLLEILPDEDQVILPEWIHYYDELPDTRQKFIAIGIDPAISQKDTADYTAMITVKVYGRSDNMRIYVLPNIINKRLTHLETIDTAVSIYESVRGQSRPTIYIEDVAYQKSLVEQIDQKRYITVKGVKVGGQDKWARLTSVSHIFQNGQILFPKTEISDRLVNQLLGFGVEKHDDLVDALTLVVHQIMEKDRGGYGRAYKRVRRNSPEVGHLNSRERHMLFGGNDWASVDIQKLQ
ncbi:MAG: hypothetical protein WD335_03595 [Candidatus Paceibacterota bacterium]